MSDVTTVQVPILARYMPDYYPEFQCLCGACRDTCCGGWEIELSKAEYQSLCALPERPGMPVRLQDAVVPQGKDPVTDQRFAKMVQQGERCLLLTEQGLCSLQLAHGEQSLPHVCRSFPRSSVDTPLGLREQSCSPGCEGVLALLYQRREGIRFIEEALPPQEQTTCTFRPSGPVGRYFAVLRSVCIDVLQDRRRALPQRLLALSWFMKDLSTQMQSADDWDVSAWIRQKRAALASPELWTLLGRLEGNKRFFVLNNIKQLMYNSSASSAYKSLRTQVIGALGGSIGEKEIVGLDLTRYPAMEERFQAAYGDLEHLFENLVVDLFFMGKNLLNQSGEAMWREHLSFCGVYSALRFMAVCGCDGHADLPQLYHVLAMTSRAFIHSQGTQKMMVQELADHGNTGLADLAILIRG